jgi:hypothetical protein
MFSGGRDSTLAALRLADKGERLALVTVSSSHLVGIQNVRQRLRELASAISLDTVWIRIKQPNDLKTDTSFYEQTCLPCHHAYVVVAGILAKILGASRLAFGYAGYQNLWPEQTPLAVSRLTKLLARHGIILELPVYDLKSREGAIGELARQSLNTQSLEQKCTRQIGNVELNVERLSEQVAIWERAIEASIVANPPVDIEVIDVVRLEEL